MACNTCQATKSIPVCTEVLILGQIAPDTEVYIFIINHSSGYTHRQESISDGSGNVGLNMALPDPSFYNPDSAYEIWATLQTSTQNDRLDITIDAETYSCFNLCFTSLYDENDLNVSYTETTLEIL